MRLNALINGVRNHVTAVRGDLFDALAPAEFDAITSNPPYVPSGNGELPARGPSRAWKAGPDGRVVLDRICAQAPARLRPGGTLLLVHSSLCGTERTLELLEGGGLEATVVKRRRGPLGPLMLERAAELEQRGVLAPGEREEEVVVVAGRRRR